MTRMTRSQNRRRKRADARLRLNSFRINRDGISRSQKGKLVCPSSSSLFLSDIAHSPSPAMPRYHEKGIRTFHPNRYTSPSSRRLGNRFGLYFHHRQIAASRHPAGGQKSHPGMSQCAPWLPSQYHACWSTHGPFRSDTGHARCTCPSQQRSRWPCHWRRQG